MKILFVGDIMGSPGRQAFLDIAIPMKKQGKVDAIVVNGENAAAGKGINVKMCESFLEAGADVITLGDHSFDQREILPFLNEDHPVLRPANFAPGCPGKGLVTVETGVGPLTVINLIGRVFMNPSDCPFRKADVLLKQPGLSRHILVDMHAEATSESVAMGWYLNGRVSCVVGTHTHVQTADDRILPGGTAYLTDAGMTGSKDSVIGCEREAVLKRFLTGLPAKFTPAEDRVTLEGFLVTTDAAGKAVACERLQIPHG